mgnify:CR=1 FL=1
MFRVQPLIVIDGPQRCIQLGRADGGLQTRFERDDPASSWHACWEEDDGAADDDVDDDDADDDDVDANVE